MPSADCHRHGLFDMPASVSQIWQKQIITVTANAANVAYCDSNRRSFTPPFLFLPLSTLLVCLCQAWGYFAWSEGLLRRQSIIILIAAHPQYVNTCHVQSSAANSPHQNLWNPYRRQAFPLRLSSCNHSYFFKLSYACSYLISDALNPAWPRFSFYNDDFPIQISHHNRRLLPILIFLKGNV